MNNCDSFAKLFADKISTIYSDVYVDCNIGPSEELLNKLPVLYIFDPVSRMDVDKFLVLIRPLVVPRTLTHPGF